MLHGILNIYKEKEYTSHDVVAKLRGIVGQKKIGHTGTLDSDAEGVLPVCLGRATKVCDLLTENLPGSFTVGKNDGYPGYYGRNSWRNRYRFSESRRGREGCSWLCGRV